MAVWSVWHDEDVAGIGALKLLEHGSGEIKSMRTHPAFLRQPVAAFLLDHLISAARHHGLRQLSLETGSGPKFDSALDLCCKRSFADRDAFADYVPNDFSQLLHLVL